MNSGPAHGPTSGGKLQLPLPLVGRDRELRVLESLLVDPGSSASAVILSGEGGVGKSRLVKELAGRATERGWHVARGRAYPIETGVPYALFSDAFLPLLREMDPDTLTVLSRGGEAELKFLFPALGPRADDPLDASGDPEEFRTRLMWNFAEFLKSYSGRTPLLIVLEDLQWADESSLRLLHFVARQASSEPMLVVCTYNDTQHDRSLQLLQTERSLVSLGVGEIHRLEPLSVEQVGELLRRTFEVEADVVGDFSRVLHGLTRGNPFFVEEIVKSLVGSGQLSNRGGRWTGWDAGDFALPGSIRDAVLARVAALSDDAREVAELTSIVGARARYPVLTSVSGLDEPRLLAALEELCGNSVLEERAEDGAIVYDFVHPLVRQTLYDEHGLQRTRMMHGRVAEAMEKAYGPDAAGHADELAFHFARTDATHLRAKATEYLTVAGKSALERRADHEAVSYLQAALERAEDDPDGTGPSKADLVPMLARAHQHLGDFDTAAELWTSMLAQVPAEHPDHPDLRRAVGMTHFWCGRHTEAHANFDAGMEAAEASGDTPAIVRLRVAKAHCLHELGRGNEALETVRPALPLAEALDDTHLLARVHRAMALLHVWIGPLDDARAHAEKAISLAGQIGDLSIEFWARWAIAVLEGMRGDTAKLAAAVDQVTELADRARSPVLRLWTAEMRIELAHGRGDWDAGLAAGEQAISLARDLNQRTLLPRLLVWTSQFHIGRGQLDQAKSLVDEAVAVSGIGREEATVDVHQVVPVYIGLAHYLVGLGDYHDAIDAAQKGLEIAEGTGYVLWVMHRLLPILAEACLWAGEIDRAAEVGERMREHATRLDHKLGFAWADACDALVLWKRGDSQGAVGLMRGAAEALEEIPMVWDATRIRRQMAGRLTEIGDDEGAAGELKRALVTFGKLGAGLEEAKARRQLREIGLRPPPRRTGDGIAGLTSTETKVAQLVVRGMSNKAIGKELLMATRTVSTHLYNIYQKLEIGGSGARFRLSEIMREHDRSI